MSYTFSDSKYSKSYGQKALADPNADLKLIADFYYKLNDDGAWVDSVTASNGLTENGAVTLQAGHVYSDAAFFNSGPYLSLSGPPAAWRGGATGDWHICAWIYEPADASTGHAWLSDGNAGGRDYLFYVLNNTTYEFFTGGVGVDVTGRTLAAWHLLCGQHRASDHQVAIQLDNGAPVTATASPSDQTDPFLVGALVGVMQWYGRVGPAQKFHAIPTSAQHDRIWNGGAGLALY